MTPASETIYALSSGGLPSGVAVIRISGPSVGMIGEVVCGGSLTPRFAHLRSIRSRNGEPIDQGLVLYFPAPASFTGEDCLELQIHGGRAVVGAVLDELSSYDGMRHSEAGEFSRRAFENGKLDLVEIEGLADLITADTEMQRRLAHEHMRGGLSALYAGWARRLTHARAMIEAELDFADEDDVPGSVSASIWTDMAKLEGEIIDHLRDARTGFIIRDGYRIVISGPPNVGKSSLLNALSKRDVAIVTDIPGTTRDILSVDLSIDGFSVTISDTAGLRETNDKVEEEGIRRARLVSQDADLVLCLSDTQDGFMLPDETTADILKVATKIDLNRESWDRSAADIRISSQAEGGLTELVEAIKVRLPLASERQSLAIPSRRRHSEQLAFCQTALRQAQRESGKLEVQSECLRQAGNALGRITGTVDVEDLLDIIFSEFCIGK